VFTNEPAVAPHIPSPQCREADSRAQHAQVGNHVERTTGIRQAEHPAGSTDRVHYLDAQIHEEAGFRAH